MLKADNAGLSGLTVCLSVKHEGKGLLYCNGVKPGRVNEVAVARKPRSRVKTLAGLMMAGRGNDA